MTAVPVSTPLSGLVPQHPPVGGSPPWRAPRRQRSLHLLGMPMLCADGLSESWLQKTCGELHWQSLSQSLRCPSEHWQDRSGRRVYAAFCGVELQNARLDWAQEGQVLQIDSELCWLGASQAWSRHRLRIGASTLGVLDLLSAFVSRHEPGLNTSVRRAVMPADVGDAPSPEAAQRLAHVRAQRQAFIAASEAGELTGRRQDTFTPCPRHDFNGAGLLYFPSFSSLADRALWQWGLWAPDEPLRARECVYAGNLDVGESLRVSLIADAPAGPDGRALVVALCSARDARPLARVRLIVGSRRA